MNRSCDTRRRDDFSALIGACGASVLVQCLLALMPPETQIRHSIFVSVIVFGAGLLWMVAVGGRQYAVAFSIATGVTWIIAWLFFVTLVFGGG